MAYKRGTGKNNVDCALAQLYKGYKKTCEKPLSYKTYATFIKEYNSRIMDAIIYERLEYKMGARLGYIRLQRRKLVPYIEDGKVVTNHILPDWKRTRDYWHKIYPDKTDAEIKLIPNKKILKYQNTHTNGYSARFFWDKVKSNVVNQSCYVFKATRTSKEKLARFIKKTGIIEYFE